MKSTLAGLIAGSVALGFCWGIALDTGVFLFLVGCANIPFMVMNIRRIVKEGESL